MESGTHVTHRSKARNTNETAEESKLPINEVHRAIHEKLKSLNQYSDLLHMYIL